MRFLTKAIVIVAAATALFASSAEAASSFDTVAATRTHLSNIRSHLQSNQEGLVAGIRSLSSSFHSQTFDDCTAASNAMTRTATNVRGCLSIISATAFNTNCAADLNSPQCSIDIGKAMAAYGNAGAIPIPGNTAGGGATNGNNNPSGPSNECIKALTDFSLNVNTKCAAALTKLSTSVIPTTTTTTDGIDAIINAQCSIMGGAEFAECKTAIGATANIQALCPDFGIADIKSKIGTAILAGIDGPMAALCVKDDADSSKYCLASALPSFSALSPKDFNPDKITDSVLSGICKPCVQTVVNKIASFGGKIAASGAAAATASESLSGLTDSLKFFNVLCTKDPTNPSKYCINIFSSINALSKKAEKSEIPTNADFAPICTPCMKAMIVQGATTKLFPVNALAAMESACTKDPQGNYCGPSVYNSVTSIYASLSASCTAGAASCSAECKAAVQTVYNSQCCVATIGFQTIITSLSQSPIASGFLPTLNAAAICAAQLNAATCPVNIAKVPVELSLPNIAFTAATKATVSAALKIALQKDLALALGVDASAIIINDFTADPANKGGVKVSITLSVDASFKASYVATLNQQTQQQGGLPLSNTAEAAQQNNAALVSGEPVSASGQASGAFHNSASIVVIAITMIAAFFARF